MEPARFRASFERWKVAAFPIGFGRSVGALRSRMQPRASLGLFIQGESNQ